MCPFWLFHKINLLIKIKCKIWIGLNSHYFYDTILWKLNRKFMCGGVLYYHLLKIGICKKECNNDEKIKTWR